MRLLFVSGNLCDGGAQRVISLVASELAERGHEVFLLLFSRNENEYPVSSKVVIRSLGNNYAEYSKISGFRRIQIVRRIVKEIRPEAAVGFLEGGYGLYVSTLGMKFPKIASVRIKPDLIMRAKGIRGAIDRFWFCHADAVVLQNEEQWQQAPLDKWNHCIVIPNPLSQKMIDATPHVNSKVKRIIMVGRLAEQKNYQLMIEVMKTVHQKYPDIVLDIFGKGHLESLLTDEIEHAGLCNVIHLRGWTQDAIKEYQNSDLFVLSSAYEGMPNALMEAMAVGIPCISTDCETGPKELIEDSVNGLLVPVGNKEKLIQAIEHFVSMNMEERQKISMSAKEKMTRCYSKQIVADKWEALFSQLIHS